MTASDEMRSVAKYLRSGRSRMLTGVKPVVAKGANNVKRDAVNNLRAHSRGKSSIPRLPGAISYDLTDGGLGAEIGPDQDKSGLAVGVEFGSSHHAPMPFLMPAADAEEPKFVDAVDKAVGDAWEHLP